MRFGIPVSGTAAHSWTMAFRNEEESFRALQRLLGNSTVFLIDTYDTIEGAHLAARIGLPFWGVRLDSGDLGALSRQVRTILDNAGFHDAKIIASNDLNEYRIAELVRSHASIDALASAPSSPPLLMLPVFQPSINWSRLTTDNTLHYKAKFSDDKSTLPAPNRSTAISIAT